MATVDATTGVVGPLEYARVISAIVLALKLASCVLLHGLIGKLITVLVLSFSLSSHLLVDLLQLIILIILLNTLLTTFVLALLLVFRVHEVLDPILLAKLEEVFNSFLLIQVLESNGLI